MISLDHLVVGCADLDSGTQWLSALLGVAPGGGGEHLGYGTHNRLWRLDGNRYLELIARQPGSDAVHPPLFGLGEAAVQARLVERPRLLSWVARVDTDPNHAHAAVALVPELAMPVAVQRGEFKWQLAVKGDGGLCAGGTLPYLIWWQSLHPSDALANAGLALDTLSLRTQDTGVVTSLLTQMADEPIVVSRGDTALVARLSCPRGELVLD